MADQPKTQSALKTYHGNCHCTAFRFTISVPEITTAYECNCSICSRKGYKWAFPPAGGFTITTPDFELTTYEFGPKTTLHKFCPVCGTGVMCIKPGMEPGQDIAINLRTLIDLDPLALPVYGFDGAAIEPQFVPHVLETPAAPDAKLYTGSCHCGNVKFAISQPTPIESSNEMITDCDCSICVRNATVLIFPSPSDLKTEISTPTTKYEFASKTLSHEFCPTCGCHVRVKKVGAGDDVKMPVNLRLFEGVDLKKMKEKVKHFHFKDKEPLYVVS